MADTKKKYNVLELDIFQLQELLKMLNHWSFKIDDKERLYIVRELVMKRLIIEIEKAVFDIYDQVKEQKL